MSSPSGLFKPAAIAILAVAAALASCTQEQGASAPSAAPAEKARIAALETKVAYLTDRQQIHDVYMRYMRAFDRNDKVALASTFWPDAQINYGTQSHTFDEFVVRHLDAQTNRHANYAHLITNESVDLKGDTAHVAVSVKTVVA